MSQSLKIKRILLTLNNIPLDLSQDSVLSTESISVLPDLVLLSVEIYWLSLPLNNERPLASTLKIGLNDAKGSLVYFFIKL